MRRFTFDRSFYIPKGSRKVADKHSDAVAYISETAGRPYAAIFVGKQAKPISNYRYRDEAEREAAIRRAFEGRQAHDKRVAETRKTPSSTATRNAAIKAALVAHYGAGKVRVTGDRGTAYGWVNVKIDHNPYAGIDEVYTPSGSYTYAAIEARRTAEAKVWELLDAAGLSREVGSYGYDDPGSDYGHGRTISIRFERFSEEA